ncbi:MAG: AraC family transcriptional regulator [Polyangiaceae bacterium]
MQRRDRPAGATPFAPKRSKADPYEERIGLTFERDPAVLGRQRVARGTHLLFPLESASVELREGGEKVRLDRATFALVPDRASYRLIALSAVAPTLVLSLGKRASEGVAREYAEHWDSHVFRTIISERRVFPRTRWVDELSHRYLFERNDSGRHDSEAARFLETELMKELYFLGRESIARATRASTLHREAPLIERARALLEARLFDDVSVRELARSCHTSESTLLRAFQRELGTTPISYLRHRRLDESVLLLESGRYNVSEVAMRVGYTNLPAFTVAFQKRFGFAPSRLRRSPAKATRLPPQGAPAAAAERTGPRRNGRRFRRSL